MLIGPFGAPLEPVIRLAAITQSRSVTTLALAPLQTPGGTAMTLALASFGSSRLLFTVHVVAWAIERKRNPGITPNCWIVLRVSLLTSSLQKFPSDAMLESSTSYT